MEAFALVMMKFLSGTQRACRLLMNVTGGFGLLSMLYCVETLLGCILLNFD